MDRPSYVGMTRHGKVSRFTPGATIFKSFDELKERLTRARPKDSTLDYAQRRGLETAHTDEAEKARTEQSAQQNRESRREALRSDSVARFKAAQKEFIQVAGIADFNPTARAAELYEEMKRASQEISVDRLRCVRPSERASLLRLETS